MASIGSLIFCTECGNLLPASKGSQKNILQCDCCGAENQGEQLQRPNLRNNADRLIPDHAPKTSTTRSKPSDFPSLLRQKLSTVQTVERHKVQTERIDANTDCPKCGVRGVRYSEVQQRSADEGSTILFNCVCGERYDGLYGFRPGCPWLT
jgi:DNA-directed RNA polymerase I subunit RPA12